MDEKGRFNRLQAVNSQDLADRQMKAGDNVTFGWWAADQNTKKFTGTVIARNGNKVIIETQHGDREINLNTDYCALIEA